MLGSWIAHVHENDLGVSHTVPLYSHCIYAHLFAMSTPRGEYSPATNSALILDIAISLL